MRLKEWRDKERGREEAKVAPVARVLPVVFSFSFFFFHCACHNSFLPLLPCFLVDQEKECSVSTFFLRGASKRLRERGGKKKG